MKKMNIQASTHDYPIIIGENVRKQISDFLVKDYSSIFIITDEHVASLYLEDVKKALKNDRVYQKIVPSGEQTKNLNVYSELLTKAITKGLDRNSLIIALGGGVVGDLAGFVAATLFRGVDYIQVPTTILAHDSSVGGKVAVNHESGKNLIGSFYAPRAVIFDVTTLRSLPEHEVRSGYAEIIKEALIADENFYKDLLKIDITDLSTLSDDQLQEHLQKGIAIKAKIVETDEKEKGERMFLNLGHTLAHALEAHLGYGKITHGEAVAIGLLFALTISEDVFQIELPYASLYKWLDQNNYPLHLSSVSAEEILQTMKKDKKTIKDQIQMVLLQKVGSPVVKKLKDEELLKYLNHFFEKLVSL